MKSRMTEEGSLAFQYCFLSLVLRHIRLHAFLGIAEGMLRAVLATLTGTSCLQFCSEPEMAISLCKRFLSKTRDVSDTIPAANYLHRALTGDQPFLLKQLASVPPRRCIVWSLSKVDSRVTCCLLLFLQHDLRPIHRFQWCALHLCYPHRAYALDEGIGSSGCVHSSAWICTRTGLREFGRLTNIPCTSKLHINSCTSPSSSCCSPTLWSSVTS